MKRIDQLAKESNMTKQEYAKWYFKQEECELLDEYVHTMKKMKYICRCGRQAEIAWNRFTQQNHRCGYCSPNGRRIKYSLEEVREIFHKAGCELLSNEYEGILKPLDYKCRCGNISKIRLNDIKNGYHCKKCGIEKQSGDKHWAWVKDREELKQRKLFRKKCYKALQSTLKAIGKEKIGSTSDWLGYGPKELQERIESHPNWKKLKNKSWHLDHIFPIQAFLDHKIFDPKIINSLDNLRPITQRENIIKKDKYDVEEFKKWLKGKDEIV